MRDGGGEMGRRYSFENKRGQAKRQRVRGTERGIEGGGERERE